MKRISFFILIIIGIVVIGSVASAGSLTLCIFANSGTDSDCCNATLNEKSPCVEVPIHSIEFVPSSTFHPDYQWVLTQVLSIHPERISFFDISKGFDPDRFLLLLPDDPTYQSSTVLLI